MSGMASYTLETRVCQLEIVFVIASKCDTTTVPPKKSVSIAVHQNVAIIFNDFFTIEDDF